MREDDRIGRRFVSLVAKNQEIQLELAERALCGLGYDLLVDRTSKDEEADRRRRERGDHENGKANGRVAKHKTP
jgi:hypothetical protein